ncbi:Rv3235 family protein [Microbacterium indicum]|uniref:Rv3235 family protein n=1 Tax=Microbacterium indicum TaxID=358100 RepID=UPI000491CEEA|nr:Rv3235 family protein [Microbacterium indicum]
MTAARSNRRTEDVRDFFARQPTRTADLPDPLPLITSLAGGVLEVIAGVRDVDQLARWLDEGPYQALLVRANLAARARSARGESAHHPAYQVQSAHHSSPADGVVEGVAVVATPRRTRAIAVRLEGADGRWRAASLAVL